MVDWIKLICLLFTDSMSVQLCYSSCTYGDEVNKINEAKCRFIVDYGDYYTDYILYLFPNRKTKYRIREIRLLGKREIKLKDEYIDKKEFNEIINKFIEDSVNVEIKQYK